MQLIAKIKNELDKTLVVIFTITIVTSLGFKFYFFRIDPTGYFFEYSAIALLISLLFYRIDYDPEQKPTNILIKGIAILLGVYALLNYQAYVFDSPSDYTLHTAIRFLAVLGAILTLWKPSFSLIPLLYTVWRKKIDTSHTTFTLSPTDYMPVVEVGLLLVVGYIVISTFRHYRQISNPKTHQIFLWILIASIGIHFGNYFHSGVAKLMLDGGPFSWTLENHTHFLMITSLEMGLLPIGAFPSLIQALYSVFENSYVALNLITLIGQLVCVFLITSPRRIIFITLFYDLMHIFIFLLTGIFFWKWIVLNSLIVTAMVLMSKEKFDTSTRSIGIIFTIVGIFAFFTAQLAWYDTKTLKHTYVEAKDTQGIIYTAPTNYFMNASLTFAQGRLFDRWPGHFAQTNALGSTASYKVMRKLNDCRPLLFVPNHKFNFTPITQFIKSHHNYVLSNTGKDDTFAYDYFPHHIWSNPLLHSRFNLLDKRQIESYRIIIESKCLKLDNNVLKHAIIVYSTSPEIPVK
jgi:hypothetical protein